jgi:hypothetical protein
MTEERRTRQADGFSVRGDKPKSENLKPTNINPPTPPPKSEDKNQKNP